MSMCLSVSIFCAVVVLFVYSAFWLITNFREMTSIMVIERYTQHRQPIDCDKLDILFYDRLIFSFIFLFFFVLWVGTVYEHFHYHLLIYFWFIFLLMYIGMLCVVAYLSSLLDLHSLLVTQSSSDFIHFSNRHRIESHVHTFWYNPCASVHRVSMWACVCVCMCVKY